MPVLSAANPAATSQQELDRILRIQVPVIVKLAEKKAPVFEVLRLGVGSIIEFVKANDDPLQLLVNNRTIAIGEAVKVGENFGLRVKQVGSRRQLIEALGGEMR